MAICNITVENDADFYRIFSYQTIDGVPIDLTGAAFIMKVRRQAEDAIAVLELSTATGEITITDAVNGMFTILITQEVLVELALGSYEHSLIMTLHGLKQGMWTGSLVINAGASR